MNIEVNPALYIVYKRVLFYYYPQRQAKVLSDENTHEIFLRFALKTKCSMSLRQELSWVLEKMSAMWQD